MSTPSEEVKYQISFNDAVAPGSTVGCSVRSPCRHIPNFIRATGNEFDLHRVVALRSNGVEETLFQAQGARTTGRKGMEYKTGLCLNVVSPGMRPFIVEEGELLIITVCNRSDQALPFQATVFGIACPKEPEPIAPTFPVIVWEGFPLPNTGMSPSECKNRYRLVLTAPTPDTECAGNFEVERQFVDTMGQAYWMRTGSPPYSILGRALHLLFEQREASRGKK